MKLAIAITVFCAVVTHGTACARPRSPTTTLPGETAEAIVGRRAARFTFPSEPVDHLTWPGHVPNAHDGFPLRSWSIDWAHEMPYERFGIDPSGISLVLRWQAGTTREWLLKDVLADSRPEIETFCRPCGTPAVTTQPDPAVRLTFNGASVVFVVVDEAVVRQLFPTVPDSVTFTRREWSGDERSITVAIQRREP
jgi:hypothetical protein